MSVPITLVCCTCGKEKHVYVSHRPQFAFELAAIACDAEMIGVIDSGHARALVFCSDECLNYQKTRTGGIRRHIRRKEEAVM